MIMIYSSPTLTEYDIDGDDYMYVVIIKHGQD